MRGCRPLSKDRGSGLRALLPGTGSAQSSDDLRPTVSCKMDREGDYLENANQSTASPAIPMPIQAIVLSPPLVRSDKSKSEDSSVSLVPPLASVVPPLEASEEPDEKTLAACRACSPESFARSSGSRERAECPRIW